MELGPAMTLYCTFSCEQIKTLLPRKPALNKKVSELLNYGLRKKNRIFSLDLDEYDTKVLTNCVKLYLNSLPGKLNSDQLCQIVFEFIARYLS